VVGVPVALLGARDPARAGRLVRIPSALIGPARWPRRDDFGLTGRYTVEVRGVLLTPHAVNHRVLRPPNRVNSIPVMTRYQ
jgi:hypothetical protein